MKVLLNIFEKIRPAFEQGGNDAYWAMTDMIYKETPSNDGLDLADLPKFAGQIGLNGDELQKCIDDERFKDFVEEPHAAICSEKCCGNTLDLTSRESRDTRDASVDIV